MFSTVKNQILLLVTSSVIVFLMLAGAGVYFMKDVESDVNLSMTKTDAAAERTLLAANSQIMFLKQVKEWKNLLLRGADSESFEKHSNEFNKKNQEVDATLDKLAAALDDPKAIAATKKLIVDHKNLTVRYQKALKNWFDPKKPETLSDVDAAVAGIEGPVDRSMQALIDDIFRDSATVIVETKKTASEDASTASQKLILVLIIALPLIVALGLLIARNILKILGGEPAYASTVVNRIANGDLTRHTSEQNHHKGLLADIEIMRDDLKGSIAKVLSGADSVGDASSQLAGSADQVAGSSRMQGQSVASVAISIEDMSANIKKISQNATKAAQASQESQALSGEGSEAISKVYSGMDEISAAVNSSSSTINGLEKKTNEIMTIVHTIKDIADQTNMLALNAAIEAARAGEHGRGFAVVADEVRKLANRTAESTDKISTTVSAILDGTREAVVGMDNVVIRVNGTVDLANQADSVIEQLRDGAAQVTGYVEDISAAIHQQGQVSASISLDIEKISAISEDNSTAAQQAANAAHYLQSLADNLKAAVGGFKI